MMILPNSPKRTLRGSSNALGAAVSSGGTSATEVSESRSVARRTSAVGGRGGGSGAAAAGSGGRSNSTAGKGPPAGCGRVTVITWPQVLHLTLAVSVFIFVSSIR